MSNSFDDIQKSLLWDIYYADGLQWFSNGMACTAYYLAKSVSLLVFTLYLFLFVALYQIVRKKFVLPRIGYSKLRIGADRSRTMRSVVMLVVLIIMLIGFSQLGHGRDANAYYLFLFASCILFLYRQIKNTIIWNGKSLFPYFDRVMILILVLVFSKSTYDIEYLTLLLFWYGLFNIVFGLGQFISFIKHNPVLENEE